MIEVTSRKGNQFDINEGNVFAAKPQESGETMLFLVKNIPTPEKLDTFRGRFLIKEGPEELEMDLRKTEEIGNGQFWYIKEDELLAKIPTEKGYIAFLLGDISSDTVPFNKRKLELKEVE